MQGWLSEEVARRRASDKLGEDMMGALPRQGLLADEAVRRALGGMLVGSIDTTASAVAKVVSVIGRDTDLEASVRRDLGDLGRVHSLVQRSAAPLTA